MDSISYLMKGFIMRVLAIVLGLTLVAGCQFTSNYVRDGSGGVVITNSFRVNTLPIATGDQEITSDEGVSPQPAPR